MAAPIERRRRTEATGSTKSVDRYRPSRGRDEEDDTDEDESPRAKRRREREEEPEPPRRSTRRAKDDDDDDDEPPARSRRRGRDEEDDDDEDEPPARTSRRRSSRDDDDDDDEPKRPARGRRGRDDDDDDEDEKPARSRRRGRDDEEDDDDDTDDRAPRKSTAGWKSYSNKRKKMGTFANNLKVPDDDQILIKFMDDEPFASFGQHWIQTSKGLRSHTCLEDKCPLDDMGDTPRPVGAFNVLVLEEDAEPTLSVWECGPQIMGLLEKKAAAKTGPLTKEYYAISKSKSGGSKKGPTTYTIDVVRARDLREEWGISPLKDAELDKWDSKLHTEEKYVRFTPRAELKALAREAMDDDD